MSDHGVTRIRVYESELDLITDETLDHHEVETGGSLFGLFGHGGAPVVFLATRPAGRVAKRSTSLELDPEVTQALEQLTWGRFGMQCIGMWHSHHWIGLTEPSGGDRERTRRYAQRHHRPKYTEILANFVGDDRRPPKGSARRDDVCVQLTPFFYPDARQLTRDQSVIEVLPGQSPLRRALSDQNVPDVPELGAALRAAGSLPETAYVLADSPASGGTRRGFRRLVPGLLSGGGSAAEHDAAPAAEEQPVPEAAASGKAAVTEESWLRPIPDLAGYVEQHIQPVMQRLAGRYEVEVELADTDRLAVVVRIPGRTACVHLLTAWDGERAVAYGCDVLAPRQHLEKIGEWPPSADGGRAFDLDTPLDWGLQQLQRLP
ncbi:hypothetical protein [Thermomonospora umbrina]|uniref:JAB domain-containing protein n=1 Tax=Thermomonospora umbrina TaxID=111806 RepID=A0A3D9SSG9_9ACTN|nr:hypothetical protein [Thermomonospora umbrina]REE96923.1 hypothetical protein DFJ69_2376 [Thermomonospora umbrina]